ncbi:MAG: hypothetical protein KIT58_03080, partial [Planctomycetota bacterium]|nr:hypothetical protein [Planctomycetota bacterium]
MPAPPGGFPLDNSFDALRKVVLEARESIMALRDAATAASRSVRGSADATRQDPAARGFFPAARDALRFTELLRAFKEVQKGITAGGTLARAFGLDEAADKMQRIAKRVEFISQLTGGIVSSLRSLRALFLPVVGAVTLLTAGLVGVQQLVNRLTGTSATLKQTFSGFALELQKGFAAGKVAFYDFKRSITGSTKEVVDDFRRAQAELGGVEEKIRELNAEISAQGPPTPLAELTLKGLIQQGAAELGELGDAAAKMVAGAFDKVDEAIFQSQRISFVDTFDRFRLRIAEIGDVTAQTFDIIADGVQALSATISSALLDAFLDPQKDIRETFANLFRYLAQQILQMLIQATIVKSLAGIGVPGFAAGGGSVPAQGLADGGTVRPGGRPSLRHFMRGAVGRALGGFGRPPGIAASDTVAAWLTPGEFVEPLRAVRHYGLQVMEGLRTLSIPREPLLALARGAHLPSRPAASPVPRGYATGGTVAPSAPAST